MKASPRNKMITSDETSNKEVISRAKKGKEVKKFYFPHLKKTVVAATFEEAQAIINKEVVK